MEIEKKIKEVFQRCRLMTGENDWKFDSEVGGVVLERKQFTESDVPGYRCSKLITGIRHDKLIDAVWNVDETVMKKIDPSILNWELIKNTGETRFNDLDKTVDFRVIRQVNYMAPLIWPRESIIVQAKIAVPNEIWFVTFSIDDDKIPFDDKKYVRPNIVFNTFGFVQKDDNTLVHKLTLVDPRGLIPIKIVTMFSHKMVNLLNYLHDWSESIYHYPEVNSKPLW